MVAFILANDNGKFNVNWNYFSTQSGRSRDPSLGRDPLFADPWSRQWATHFAVGCRFR